MIPDTPAQNSQDVTLDAPDSPLPASASGRPAHHDPERIGPYRVLERIGEGGMGVVYKAEQREPVRRVVALKVIKLGMDTKEVVARFEAERQALAMLSHPNVAKVLDAGTTASGRPYFAMEHVAGVSLTRYCRENRLGTRQRLELFVPICQAVQHAHQKGVIHRDLKPSNILITLEDGKPVPKVIDFGIAKATNQALTLHTLYTQTGALVGTPEYMSPEQAMTSGLDVDTRTDIYSLGVILYELLTGALPLDASSLRAAGLEGMARLIKTSEPAKPSTRLLTRDEVGEPGSAAGSIRNTRALQRELRGDLDWIVLKAIDKDRARRYETANALAMDVRRHLDNEPVAARPPSAAYRVRKFVSKHRFGVLAGAAVLAALLVGLALATVGFVRAKADRDIADAARIDAEAQKKIADEQRRLAVDNARKAVENARLAGDNARKADDNARNANVRLAHGMVSQADALSLAGRFADAHGLYTTAYDQFVELKQPLIMPRTGLWSSYEQATFPLLALSGHQGGVLCVAITADGRTGLSGGNDGMLRLWDLPSGTTVRTFKHKSAVTGVAILPNGLAALSCGLDGTLKLWDLTTGNEVRTLTGHVGPVHCIAVDRDGATALSGGQDKTLRRWDLASGKELRTFTGHDAEVSGVAIFPDGQTAMSSGGDKTLRVWNLASGTEVRRLSGHAMRITSVAISYDGRLALSGSWDNTVKLWDLTQGTELRTFVGHNAGVETVLFAPDGRTVLSTSGDYTIKRWDLATGSEVRTLTGHTNEVKGLCLSADGRIALSGGRDGLLMVWSLSAGAQPRGPDEHTNWVNGVALSPDGRTALTASNDHTLKLWDLAGGNVIRTFAGHARGPQGVAYLPDGRSAVSGSDDRTLKRWDLTTGDAVRTFTGHTDRVTSVAVAADGRTALSGSADRTLKLWDLSSGETVRTLTGHRATVTCVALVPGGSTAVSGSQDGTIKLWDLASGQAVRTLTGHRAWVTCVAVSKDGRRAVSGGWDKAVKLWDLDTGRELHSFTGHVITVTGVAFGPDGRTALSCGWDKTVKLWDLESASEIRTFTRHPQAVLCVAASADGQTVLSGSVDHRLRVWNFDRGPAQRAMEPVAAAAQATLARSPNDPAALATLGGWYALRGMDAWAIEFLGRARERGAAVAPLTLARCYWKVDRFAEARREFDIVRELSKDPTEKSYLGWCVAAIDDARNQFPARTLAAAAAAARRGQWTEAGEGFKQVIERSPDEHYAWYCRGSLLAYRQDAAEYRTHCKAMLERFGGSEKSETLDRTAKTCLLRPDGYGGDAAPLLAAADKLLAHAETDDARAWFNLLKALAQYRAGGDDPGCLASARRCKDLGGTAYAPRAATADLLVAMASQRMGQSQEARTALDAALARINRDLPPPSEEHPLRGMTLEDWLICQTLRGEAEGLVSKQ